MGLKVLLNGRGPTNAEEPEVDIIAIHGLNPRGLDMKEHGYGTWKKGDHLWLEDLKGPFPRARVMLQYYDANPTSNKRYETFLQQSQQILSDIWVKRTPDQIKDPKRPIIFLMHSLGGLVIKQAMVEAKLNDKFKDILESMCGLAFFATPHGGGNASLVLWGGAATSTWNFLAGNKKSDILDPLTRDNVVQEHLKDHFRQFYEKVQIVSFYERYPTRKYMVVNPLDARLNLAGERENIVGLDATHSDICRFDPTQEADQDVWEPVLTNLKDLHRKVLQSRGELLSLSSLQDDSLQAEHLVAATEDTDLESRFKQLGQ